MIFRRDRGDLSQPRQGGLSIGAHYDPEAFGRVTEGVARFIGTGRYLVIQTVMVVTWIILNTWAITQHWDPYPFILLNLAFSTQAAYAAPLILLAQNRQDARDRQETERDRETTARTQADTEYVARELASMRLTLANVISSEDLAEAVDRVTSVLNDLSGRIDAATSPAVAGGDRTEAIEPDDPGGAGHPDVRRARRHRGPAVRVVVLLVALALSAAGCSGTSDPGARSSGPATATGPSTAPPASTSELQSRAGAAEAQIPPPVLDWKACDGGFECATVDLPLDYAQPHGRTISIGVARQKARDPSRRIGALFVNPGGPGASAISFLEGFGFDDQLADRFDLVAIDPRGVGRSTKVDCDEKPAELYAPDPTMEDRADRDHYIEVSQDYVDKCRARNGDLLQHVGTRDTARDMDQVRRGLGDDQLSYLGFSYGTALGQAYADLFPTRIRAMVLDGVVDLSIDGPEQARRQADGFELALDHFVRDCVAQGDTCPIAPDPRAVIASVVKRSEASPIPSSSADRAAGPGEVSLGLGQALYSEGSWPTLARALAKADHGDGSGLVDLANDYLDLSSGDDQNTTTDGYFAISCLDQAWPRDPDAVLADAKEAGRSAPTFGEAFTNDYLRCALWPAKADPLTTPRAVGSPVIVVVGTTGDPATPYEASVDLARALPRGRLLTNDGEGHTAYGSACVTGAVDTYLLTLDPPSEGKRCTG